MATSPSKEQSGGVGITSRSEAFQAEDQPPTEGPSQMRGLWLIPPPPPFEKRKEAPGDLWGEGKGKALNLKRWPLAAVTALPHAGCGRGTDFGC